MRSTSRSKSPPAARVVGAALALLCTAATTADIDRWAQGLADIDRVAGVMADARESMAVRAHAARALAALHHPTVDGGAALRRALEAAAPEVRGELLREASAALELRLRDESPEVHTRAFDTACALLGTAEGDGRARLAAAMLDRALDPAGGGLAPSARCSDADVAAALGRRAVPRLLQALSLGERELPLLSQVTKLLRVAADEAEREQATTRVVALTRELLAPPFAPTLRARARGLLTRSPGAEAPTDARVDAAGRGLRRVYLTVLAEALVDLGAASGVGFLRTLAGDASLSDAERAVVGEALQTPARAASPAGAAFEPAPAGSLDDARRANASDVASMALPTAPPRSLSAVPPSLRVIVSSQGVSVDHVDLVASWPAAERERLVGALPPPWGQSLPLAYRGVPSLTGYAVPVGALRGGATGLLLLPLQHRLRDLAWIDRALATAAGRPSSTVAALYADGAAPHGVVMRALFTLGHAGYPRVALVARGGRRLGAVTVGGDTRAAWGLQVRPDGFALRTRGGWIGPGCTDVVAAPTVTVPRARGRLDLAGLRRCLLAQTAREASADRGAIALAADEALPYREVFEALLALRESRPGRGDLFPDVQIAVLR